MEPIFESLLECAWFVAGTLGLLFLAEKVERWRMLRKTRRAARWS